MAHGESHHPIIFYNRTPCHVLFLAYSVFVNMLKSLFFLLIQSDEVISCPFLSGGTLCSSSNRNDGGTGGDSSTVFHLPAEFFHPAAAALPAPPRVRLGHKPRGLRLTSPASWASLRSPGANLELLTAQVEVISSFDSLGLVT